MERMAGRAVSPCYAFACASALRSDQPATVSKAPRLTYPDDGIVLVVEDEPLLLMHTVLFLEDEGFKVLQAGNADEAIRLLETRVDIRIVLTDIEMPGSMDGLKLARAIRDRWPPIHLVIVSGRSRPGPNDLPERGVFFPKPYDNARLIEAIRGF